MSGLARAGWVLALLACAVTVPSALADDNGLAVQVPPSKDECFYEDIAGVGVKVFLHYMVTSGGALDIGAEVTGPDRAIIWASPKDSENRVLFKTRHAGRHSFCFSNAMSTVTPKVVAFSVQVGDGAGKQEGTVSGQVAAAAESPDSLQSSIARLQKGLSEVLEVQDYMRTRERMHRATTEVGNSRVVLFSVIEVLVIIGMCVANIFYIRKMFTTKRMV